MLDGVQRVLVRVVQPEALSKAAQGLLRHAKLLPLLRAVVKRQGRCRPFQHLKRSHCVITMVEFLLKLGEQVALLLELLLKQQIFFMNPSRGLAFCPWYF